MAAPVLATTPLGGDRDAPLLLVLPSLGGTVDDWRPAARLLERGWRVVGVDLPGHGASAAVGARFTVEDVADAVDEVAGRLSRDPYAVAGVSLGGGVALELALRHPERLTGLAIVCSAPRMGDPESWAERASSVRSQGTGSLVSGLAERWFTPPFRESSPDVVGRVLDGVAATDDESYALCCEALGEWDARGRIAELDVDGVAILGADDPVATPETTAPLRESPRLTTVVIADVRHQAAIERPSDVAGALLEHL